MLKRRRYCRQQKEIKLHQNVVTCYICGKRFTKKFAKDKNYWKVRDHCHFTGKYRGAVHIICNLRFNVLNEFPAVFCNESNYDYHFIIKELANGFEGQFECLRENRKVQNIFLSYRKRNHNHIIIISWKIKFINSAWFMTSSLSNFLVNLTEGIYKIKFRDYDWFLEYESVKDIW